MGVLGHVGIIPEQFNRKQESSFLGNWFFDVDSLTDCAVSLPTELKYMSKT